MTTARRFPALGLLALVLAPAACGEEPTPDRFAGPTVATATRDEAQEAEPILLQGAGPATERIPLAEGRPLVVAADVPRGGRFSAELAATGIRLVLFDESAPVTGEVAVPGRGPGPVEITVETKARWALEVSQPVPTDRDAALPGSLSGRGNTVVQVRVPAASPARVRVAHRGDGRFAAWLFPYDEFADGRVLVEGSGRVSRTVALAEPLEGSHVLGVWATGRWSLRFQGA
jgi:hypothetical protein